MTQAPTAARAREHVELECNAHQLGPGLALGSGQGLGRRAIGQWLGSSEPYYLGP